MSATLPMSEVVSSIGSELGVSDWMEITQQRVNDFADATLDHQFIHIDPERAAVTPFGGTIAHGFLTLSLLPHFLGEAMPQVENTLMALNYGSDKVRFLQPVSVGARIRARTELMAADEKRPDQWLLKLKVTMEIENEKKPALIAEMLTLYFLG